MNPSSTISSPCLSANRIRSLVVDIERLGVDASRISVEAEPPRTAAEVGGVDGASVSRPASRVAVAAATGVVVGILIALVVVGTADVPAAPTLLIAVLAGAILGGLAGLYSRLAVNNEVSDVDTGQLSFINVDTEGLNHDTRSEILALVGRSN